MTDPDSSTTGVVVDEWFRNNKDLKLVLTRHHSAFAERVLRTFTVDMHKLIQEHVRARTEYLGQALGRMSQGRQPTDTITGFTATTRSNQTKRPASRQKKPLSLRIGSRFAQT